MVRVGYVGQDDGQIPGLERVFPVAYLSPHGTGANQDHFRTIVQMEREVELMAGRGGQLVVAIFIERDNHKESLPWQ